MSENAQEHAVCNQWYVLQVMSGKEFKVFDSLSFECSKVSDNVIELDDEQKVINIEYNKSGRSRVYRALFKGYVHGIHEINILHDIIEERVVGGKARKSDGSKPENKKIRKFEKLYAGYVLVRAELLDQSYTPNLDNLSFLQDTKGVIGVIGAQRGQKPVPLTPEEVAAMDKMNNQTEEEKVRPKVQYNIGESVIIRSGPFANTEAVIENIDEERGLLKLSVTIFGRSTPVEIEFGQVERP